MAKKKADAPVAKAPSRKTQGFAIFDEELKRREAGAFDGEDYPNKAFRKHVIGRMMAEITDKEGNLAETSLASASTMYNQAKQAAEADNPKLGLGRDPKVVKVKAKAKAKPKAKSKAKAEETPAEAPAEETAA